MSAGLAAQAPIQRSGVRFLGGSPTASRTASADGPGRVVGAAEFRAAAVAEVARYAARHPAIAERRIDVRPDRVRAELEGRVGAPA